MPKAKASPSSPRCRPEVFLAAAELIDAHEESFACNALYTAAGAPGGWSMEPDLNGDPLWHRSRDTLPEVQLFTKLFKPKKGDRWTDLLCNYGDGSAWYETSVSGAELVSSRSSRVLALCFAAHLVAEEDVS